MKRCRYVVELGILRPRSVNSSSQSVSPLTMASASVAFTVDPLASRDDAVQLNLRLESKRAAGKCNTKCVVNGKHQRL